MELKYREHANLPPSKLAWELWLYLSIYFDVNLSILFIATVDFSIFLFCQLIKILDPLFMHMSSQILLVFNLIFWSLYCFYQTKYKWNTHLRAEAQELHEKRSMMPSLVFVIHPKHSESSIERYSHMLKLRLSLERALAIVGKLPSSIELINSRTLKHREPKPGRYGSNRRHWWRSLAH